MEEYPVNSAVVDRAGGERIEWIAIYENWREERDSHPSVNF
jgi:hypothetical protein